MTRIKVDTWEPAAALADLGAWDDAITALDTALADAARARLAAQDAEQNMAIIEARTLLVTTGGNAETRKAALMLALAEDGAYQESARGARSARMALAGAERRAAGAKERGRLLRAALALAAGTPAEA